MTREEALARVDLARFLEELGDQRGLRTVRGMYPCPDLAHVQSGDSPPASLKRQGGVEVWYCHSCEKGGTYVDALVACGRAKDAGDALEQMGVAKPQRDRPSRGAPTLGREVARYVYEDEHGAPRLCVVRYEPKTFRQQRWEDGGWVPGLGDTELVLYHLPQVLEAKARNDYIFVCEGEKDADAVRAAGQCATTAPGGADKWLPAYTETLKGARVIVMADDDDAGHKHATKVFHALYGRAARVAVRLPAEGFKDIHDHLAAGKTLSELRKAPTLEAQDVHVDGPQMFTAKVFASRAGIGARLQVVGPLIQRGMRTTIGAGTGEGKTTLAFQAIRALVTGEPFLDERWQVPTPGRALIIDLEQGEETVKTRLVEAGLHETDAVDVLWEPAGVALDSDPAHQALIRDTVRRGRYDLVLADPLYQMHRGNANDERAAADLMRLVDGWSREFNFALVIPMHARKPHPQAGKQMTIHDIAGSGAWNRNAEFVLGLQVMSTGNSRLHFFKDRIGQGPALGSHWWLSFTRDAGFARTHKEDRDHLRATLRTMLDADEGVTREELAKAGADEVMLKSLLKGASELGGRYRAKPWHEQTTLSDGMT